MERGLETGGDLRGGWSVFYGVVGQGPGTEGSVVRGPVIKGALENQIPN